MLHIGNIRVRSFDIGYLDVFWDVLGDYDAAAEYDLQVLRSEAQFGPFFPITGPFRQQDRFRDTSVPGYQTFYTRVFYKIRVTHRTTQEVQDFPEECGVRLEAMPDLMALEMARMERLMLKQHKGRQMWVFPRRHTGQRCSVCIDPVTRQRLRASCMSCYGTGFAGGFYAPIEVYGQIPTPAVATATQQLGKVAAQDTMLMLANYPLLTEGDVVIEAENIRWRVGGNINVIEKQRAPIRQQAQIKRIDPNEVEYSLPLLLTDDEVRNMRATPADNYTNPRTLGQNSLEDMMLGMFGAR